MRNLVLFLEKIGQAPYPISVTKLSVRKRAGQKDSWDSTMIVSAYHRKEAPKDKSESGEDGE